MVLKHMQECILVLCDFMMDVFGAAVAHLHIVFVKQLFEMPRVEVFLDKVWKLPSYVG